MEIDCHVVPPRNDQLRRDFSIPTNMHPILLIIFATGATLLSFILTKLTIKKATQLKIVDKPTGGRKIHNKPIPLLGGVPIMVTFFLIGFLALQLIDLTITIPQSRMNAILIGSFIILLLGIIDDQKNLKAHWQLGGIVLAVLIATLLGTNLTHISNPFGGIITLTEPNITFGPFAIFIIADAIVFAWLMLMTGTTKLLDGLDGLVTGIVTIGAILIAGFSMFSRYYQPDIALAAAILAGSCLGFLVLNHHPAKIFLGSVGSIWLGYILGVLAVISGGKIAIALLVLGVPLIDMLIVVLRRMKKGKSPLAGDATHLHFRLMKTIGHKKTVYLYWALAAGFGGLTVIAQGSGKMIAFGVLVAFSLAIIVLSTSVKKT
ncbi:MAG: hypothetical protein CMI52_03605 [Parcubacteria group bacterium]|nr:hypothetical protein [Parcubacteria group bacterium]